MEKWPSGLRRHPAKVLYGVICIQGSNPCFSDFKKHPLWVFFICVLYDYFKGIMNPICFSSARNIQGQLRFFYFLNDNFKYSHPASYGSYCCLGLFAVRESAVSFTRTSFGLRPYSCENPLAYDARKSLLLNAITQSTYLPTILYIF